MRYTVILQKEEDGGYVATVRSSLAVFPRATLVKKRSKILKKLSRFIWKTSAPLVRASLLRTSVLSLK